MLVRDKKLEPCAAAMRRNSSDIFGRRLLSDQLWNFDKSGLGGR